MRTLINYIRSCFCKHEWEVLEKETAVKYGERIGTVWTYRCKKCGYFKIYKNY